MRIRFFVVVAFIASLANTGCSGGASDTPNGSVGATSMAASGTTTGTGVFPIIVVLDDELQAAAHAAAAQSNALDQRCASIPMAAELHSKRPGGTGCPRPETTAEAVIEVQP